MRICRFAREGASGAAFYDDSYVVPIKHAANAFHEATGETLVLPESDKLIEFLPPDGSARAATQKLHDWLQQQSDAAVGLRLTHDSIELLVPIARPNKIFLLAGNYAAHVEEGGEIAAERAETFPYVFMKPPTTTLTNPGSPIRIPSISPDTIDWELELAVIIGRNAKGVSETDALNYVAGYTVINDISNRRFRPNADRKKRDKDGFFDWLHGKWHDSFCPCGPCIASADSIADPQQLEFKLRVNGDLKQDGSTSQQIFPVAAVIEFISSFVTLEPGDIISTGTAAGVGNTTGTYLKPGDVIEASISSIGTLISPVTDDAG
ncbi:MAG: fumarylacetoacetate hydrolase family protein [Planctomycetes bacterium]|nr:fumarylacetoacetate hydrolase family protein [Planctomycetota bacterium]